MLVLTSVNRDNEEGKEHKDKDEAYPICPSTKSDSRQLQPWTRGDEHKVRKSEMSINPLLCTQYTYLIYINATTEIV